MFEKTDGGIKVNSVKVQREKEVDMLEIDSHSAVFNEVDQLVYIFGGYVN